jgi:hypothetical protein
MYVMIGVIVVTFVAIIDEKIRPFGSTVKKASETEVEGVFVVPKLGCM